MIIFDTNMVLHYIDEDVKKCHSITFDLQHFSCETDAFAIYTKKNKINGTVTTEC